MRLTLRTLLAYLDDVLNAEEAEQLRHRIEESEFASTLVQRIRHTVQRLKLSAPKVDGRGLGFDPNSVAEYLDSTMPGDRVADFEKQCLESDVHLAEVAACHQILAKVLNEPAHVSDALRQHIHSLKDLPPVQVATAGISSNNGRAADGMAVTPPPVAEVTPPPVEAVAPPAVEAVAPPAPPAPHERPQLQVPDYLRPEPKSATPYIVALTLLGTVAAVTLFCLPPLNQYNPLFNNRSDQNTVVAANNPDGEAEANTTSSALDSTEGAPTKRADDTDAAADEHDIGASATVANKAAAGATASPVKRVNPEAGSRLPSDESGDVEPRDDEPRDNEPRDNKSRNKEPRDSAVADKEKIEAGRRIPAATAILEGAPEVSDDPLVASPLPAVAGIKPVRPSGSAAEESEPSNVLEIGRFISDETALATFHDDIGNWLRVDARALILDGQRLLALPVSRPQIALSSGVQVTLVGETHLRFGRTPGEGLPQLAIESGRALLQSVAKPNVKTSLVLAGIQGVLTLDTGDSEAAIEVGHYLAPGADPLSEESAAVLGIFCMNGSITWQPQGGEPLTIKSTHGEGFVAGEGSRHFGPIRLPLWIDARNTLTLDREAAKIVEPLLPMDRPLVLALQEIANHRRLDVRVHVARCLAALGHCEAIIKELNEEEYRAYWMRADGCIETLRSHIARGSSFAERLQTQLVETRGEKDGLAMFRLLRGYSEQQLLSGGADALVTGLAQPNMDVRVLAIDNLNRITGTMHLYNAAQSPEKSRPRILKWQDLLKAGTIAYTSATKPSPFAEFNRLEAVGGSKER